MTHTARTNLNENGADQPKDELVPQRKHGEPDGRGQQQRHEPEEGRRNQDDDPDGVVGDGQREHGHGRAERQEGAAEEFYHGHGYGGRVWGMFVGTLISIILLNFA